jgi:hypothetical protein
VSHRKNTVTAALVAAAVALAPTANADPVDDYAARNATAVCSTLDSYPTFEGIIGIGQAIVEQGFTWSDAGKVVGTAVFTTCPRHGTLLANFVRQYSRKGPLV